MITIIQNLAYPLPPNLNIYSLEHIQILTEIFFPVTNIIILSPSRNLLSILYLEIDLFLISHKWHHSIYFVIG